MEESYNKKKRLSVIQKSNLESTIVNTNVKNVFEMEVVNSLTECFKTFAISKQYSTLFKFITDIFVDNWKTHISCFG